MPADGEAPQVSIEVRLDHIDLPARRRDFQAEALQIRIPDESVTLARRNAIDDPF